MLTPHFAISEFACNDRDNTPVPQKYYGYVHVLAKQLEIIRQVLREKYHPEGVIVVNSGYRTKEYNDLVGGAKNSQHLKAKAADIRFMVRDEEGWRLGADPRQVGYEIEKLMQAGDLKHGGIGFYDRFTHVDIRGTIVKWGIK